LRAARRFLKVRASLAIVAVSSLYVLSMPLRHDPWVLSSAGLAVYYCFMCLHAPVLFVVGMILGVLKVMGIVDWSNPLSNPGLILTLATAPVYWLLLGRFVESRLLDKGDTRR
jgi:hypothetical protein